MAEAYADAGTPSMTGEQPVSSMEMKTIACVQRTPTRRPLHRTFAATVLAAVLGLTGCEGDNLFSGGPAGGAPGPQGPPSVTSIETEPAGAVPEGGVLDVRVKASAPAGMASI